MNEIDRYNSIVQSVTPRLWVEYKDDGPGGEIISWGVHGHIPPQLVIAATIRAQVDLCSERRHVFETCPETKFIIAWPNLHSGSDLVTLGIEDQVPINRHEHVRFLHPQVPIDQLLVMLEVAKSTVIAAMLMHQQSQKLAENRVQAYGRDGKSIIN